MDRILIVEDDCDLCGILTSILISENFEATSVENGKKAIEEIKKTGPDLVLLDYNLPDCKGIDLIKEIHAIDSNIVVIMLTAHSVLKEAVNAMRLGAYDYITKPFDNDELVLVIKKGLQTLAMKKEIAVLKEKIKKIGSSVNFRGENKNIKNLLSQVDLVAPTTMSVLLYGESGTGKDLIAKLIHEKSERKDKPYIALDCGAIPETLIESVLFGHEKGSYTGADFKKEGEFKLAHGGTIFLDEITNLPENAQSKLLRVLQEKVIHPLGSTKEIPVDVRIIAATNIRPSEALKSKKIRMDLFYRLNEFMLSLPPLRERKDDIVILSNHFLNEAMVEFGKRVEGISTEALSVLSDYDWPGNVRELKNTIRRALLTCVTISILPEDIALNYVGSGIYVDESILESETMHRESNIPASKNISGNSLQEIKREKIKELEKEAVINALKATAGNKTKAAKLLKIDRMTLYAKLKEYNI